MPVRLLTVSCGAPLLAALLTALLTLATAAGQELRYAEWRLVESAPETLDYRNALRNGVFDDNARSYLRDVALPQLAAPGNQATIDRVRRRLRDITCDPSGAANAVDQAGRFVIDFMKAVAADEKADITVRVNAMLLIGDTNAKGGKPLADALAPLTAAVGDARLPAAVRIAAAAGLARHVDAADGPLPAPTAAALVALVSKPADADPVAAEWLAARALGMLTRLGPAAPQPAVAAAGGMLSDPDRSPDLRVRAAAVVGAAAAPTAGIDVAKAVAAIREIARTTLEAEATRDAATSLEGLTEQGGTQPVDGRGGRGVAPGGFPGQAGGFPAQEGLPGQTQGPVQVQACRRAAWRLDTLGKALGGEDGSGGLARLAGPAQADVKDLAAVLRAAAVQIDAEPDVFAIREALQNLAAGPAAGGEAAAAPGPQRPADRSTPAADPGDAPFSPFGQ
jgi:hypothetical protein